MSASRRSRASAGKRDRRRPSGAKPINIGDAAVVPPKLREGQRRCPACRNAVTLTPKTGRLRKHRDLFGADCWNTATGEASKIAPPPIILPPEPADRKKPSRLDVGSNCRDCGKWLPGERSLCGRCAREGGRRR